MLPFRPKPARTQNIDVAAGCSNPLQLNSGPGPRSIRVRNAGSAEAFIEFGDATVSTTLATGIPIGSNATEVFDVEGPVWVCAIAVGATGKIYFTPGTGI